MTLEQALAAIQPVDAAVYTETEKRWDAIAKPLKGLGLLEKAVCHVAAALGTADVAIDKRALAVFCADNGVVAEGVSQSGSEVTGIVAQNLCENTTSVCSMAAAINCQVIPVDMGMLVDIAHPRMQNKKSRYGTGNIAHGPAMTREEAIAAMEAGIDLALECKWSGISLLAAGEMGIGNTTTSSAVAAVLLGREPAAVTGRGAGLSNAALQQKVAVIEKAIAVNQPDPTDVPDILCKVGGLDIAAMCGFYLGAAVARLPVVLDGFIAGVAALCAVQLCPATAGYLLASHQSAEPGAALVLEALGLQAVLHADMHLGEGTGAIAFIPLLDIALTVYRQSTTFTASNIEAYVEQE